jgi:hypothetical protein
VEKLFVSTFERLGVAGNETKIKFFLLALPRLQIPNQLANTTLEYKSLISLRPVPAIHLCELVHQLGI